MVNQYFISNPKASVVLTKLGQVSLYYGKLNEAYKLFYDAIHCDENSELPRIFRASVLREKGRFKRALKELKNTVWGDYDESKNIGLYLELACIHIELKQFDKAIKEINNAIEKDPNNISLYLDRAAIYDFNNEPEKAAQDIAQVSKMEKKDFFKPDYATCLLNRIGSRVASCPQDLLAKKIYEQIQEERKRDPFYSGEFEQFSLEKSERFDLEIIDISGLGIGWVNGIKNSESGSKANAKMLSEMAGGLNIHGVYNASHGFRLDLIECLLGLSNVSTEPVKNLHGTWNDFFKNNPDDAVFLQVCHSQGAIHVRNALEKYPEELRKRIQVVAVAPAAYISADLCLKVDHYTSSRDFIPWIDYEGRDECQETIHVLSGNGFWDHSFDSITYRDVLEGHIQDYIEQYGNKIKGVA
ncbi:MAG: hypothetical protein ACI9S8_000315 [Chlamydiales bacterium]|jgi:hypothetical protein